MKIIFISTYLPQECGIATFTGNLAKAILSNLSGKDSVDFIAILQEGEEIDYPDEVKMVVRKQVLEDYAKAAKFVNQLDYDLCIIQHEYGIFGGDSGVFIQTFAGQLVVPFIVTTHTVLKQPSVQQRSIMKWFGANSQKIVVMTNKAKQFLRDIYEIPAKKIYIIEHGVPQKYDVNRTEVLKELHLDGRKVLMTFGLIGRNKGLETVIRALPAVVNKHPDVIYFVLGNTHPAVIRHEGEKYREELITLADNLGVKDHVLFRKGFWGEEQLFKLLHAIDIYITPYNHEEQITSGTLSYAIGAGAAIVSTPYWHAQELLSDDRGKLFNFRDDKQLADILNTLLDNEDAINKLRDNALSYAHHLRWKNTGKRYITLAENIFKLMEMSTDKLPTSFNEPGLNHIKKLTDSIGIYQHSIFGLPNYHEGYCLDDNARALLAMTMAAEEHYARQTAPNAESYLSFIHFMQQANGWFHNFLGFDRRILDEKCSEDAFGRTMWALGYLLSSSTFTHLHHPAKQIFDKAMPHFNSLCHIRGIANTMIGLKYFIEKNPSYSEAYTLLKNLTDKLKTEYRRNADDDWRWFSDALTYDNGILPLALFRSYEITGDEESKSIAIESTNFLERVVMEKGYLSLVGSNGWYYKGKTKACFPQQAIDAMSMVLLYRMAYSITADKHYFENMMRCYRWFFFENDLCASLYEPTTEGCYDGLEDYGLNQNQGAESTLALFISHYAVVKTLKNTDAQIALEHFRGFGADHYNAFKESVGYKDIRI